MTRLHRTQLLRLLLWSSVLAQGGYILGRNHPLWMGVVLVSCGVGGLTNVLNDARRGGMR